MSGKIQAVLFKKNSNGRFPDWGTIHHHLTQLGVKPIKAMHKTDNYERYRILHPNYKLFKYRIIKNPDKPFDLII